MIATGARSARLPMLAGTDRVVHLRDLSDARLLRHGLARRKRLGITAGGFIGLEIAASARALGCEVDLIETNQAPLSPVLGAELGGWVQVWHEEQGVRFHCGGGLRALRGISPARQLVLSDESVVDVDLVVVGVGVVRDVDWLAAAGLETHRGLVCDARGGTSDPDVYGVGDVTCLHCGTSCAPTGHWTATNEQARAAADAILGRGPQARAVRADYFWSDQYERRLHFAGTTAPSPRSPSPPGRLRVGRSSRCCATRTPSRASSRLTGPATSS